MENTEMVIFSANAASSSVLAYKGGAPGTKPTVEPTLQSCYTTKTVQNNDGTIFLTAERPLDCGIAESYVIKLDEDLSLIAAWSATNPALVYHEGNRMEFKSYLASDGTCTDSTPTPTPPTPTPPTPTPVPVVEDACLTSLGDKGSFIVKYDLKNEKLHMNVTLPDTSFAGWGWGASMVDTEMVIFSANGDSSSATTYYSSKTGTPSID